MPAITKEVKAKSKEKPASKVSNVLKVLPTNTPHRRFAKGDYIISIHKKTKRALKIGLFAVVVYRVKYHGPEECIDGLLKKDISCEQLLKVHARVISVGDKVDKAMRLNQDEIRIDQSIRNAIGIPYTYSNETVEIYPIKMNGFHYATYLIRYFITRLLGFRYFFYRACSAHVHDMEKGICRIPADTFPVLGTDVQNKLVFESPRKRDDKPGFYEIRTRSIASHELTEEIKELRLGKETEKEIRYRNPKSWISVEPDISRVFLDQADRQRLGVDQLYPVKARRDLFDLLMSQILGVGIFFFISSLSIGGLLPFEKSWANLFLTFLAGLVISVGLMMIILRTRIK